MVESILKSLIELAGSCMEFFAEGSISVLGCDLTIFEKAFPIVGALYAILQGFAIGLVFLLVLWQAFKTFGLPLGLEAENPVMVMVKGLLAIFCILFAKDIFLDYLFPLFKPTYDAIAAVDGQITPGVYAPQVDVAGDIATGANIAFLGVSAIVKTLICGICLILILINFIGMLLEMVERYIFIGVMVYTSPLAFATAPAQSTSSIFKSWQSMVFGQLVMLLLNIWTIKMFFSVMGSSMKDDQFILWFFMTLGFLKVAQRLDSYMQQLGVNVGTTGGELAAEIFSSCRKASVTAGKTFKGFGKATSFGGGVAAGTIGGAAMAAAGNHGENIGAIMGRGIKSKNGVQEFAKSALRPKWTTPGTAGVMAAGVSASKPFKEMKSRSQNKMNKTGVGKAMFGTGSAGSGVASGSLKPMDMKKDAQSFINNSGVMITGGVAEAAFARTFNGGQNIPEGIGKARHVSVGNGMATATITENQGKTRINSTYQFARADMYNKPAGTMGKDWSMCQDNNGNSYYVTKSVKDSVNGKKRINTATPKTSK